MLLLEPMESPESETAASVGGELRAPEPVFSELIDRWLLEGERLDEQARPAADAPPPPPETWQKRALELGGSILEKHRLEVLVGIGLVPLMLFLIVAGGGHRQPGTVAAPAGPPRASAAVAGAPVAAQRSAPVALVSMPESPHVRAVPKPAPNHHKRVAHRATHTPPPFKPAPSKTALSKPASPKPAPAKLAPAKPAPTKLALSKPAAAAPRPAPPKPAAPAHAQPKRR